MISKIKTKLECSFCGKKFGKASWRVISENRKKKYRICCSRSCAGKLSRGVPKPNFKIRSKFDGTEIKCSSEDYPFYLYLYNVRKIIRQRRKRGKIFEFNLDILFLKKLWNDQKGKCAYLNIPIELVTKHEDRKSLIRASLDRKNSNLGYTKDNIHFVSLFMNYAKNSFTHQQILDFLKQNNISVNIQNETISKNSPTFSGEEVFRISPED